MIHASVDFAHEVVHPATLRPQVVHRSHLIALVNAELRQDHGFGRKLTLISAAAGFGKTTLVSEWVASLPAAGSLAVAGRRG